MEFDVIAIVTCDDCGKSLVSDASLITLFHDTEEISGVALCIHCQRPVTCVVSTEDALSMMERGVKMFSWLDGKEVSLNDC